MELYQTPYIIFFTVFAFALGACIGSFLNATAMRTVAEKKWWGSERSVCDHCGETLQTRDLIPILSFLGLKGRCRYCGGVIGKRHFVAEVICGTLTAGLFLRWGLSPALAVALVVLWFSLFNGLTDYDNGYIYDVWAVAPGVIGLLIRIAGGKHALIDGLLGGALGFCFIALIILVSRGGMGWGDAMIMLGIGAAVGWKYCAFSLYAGFLIGGLAVLPRLVSKKLKRKDAIPLGPYLAVGAVLVLFIGNALIAHFADLIGRYPGWPWGA